MRGEPLSFEPPRRVAGIGWPRLRQRSRLLDARLQALVEHLRPERLRS